MIVVPFTDNTVTPCWLLKGSQFWSPEEDRDAFSVGVLIISIRGWRSSSLPTATNLLPFGQRTCLVAAGSRAVFSVVNHSIYLPIHMKTAVNL